MYQNFLLVVYLGFLMKKNGNDSDYVKERVQKEQTYVSNEKDMGHGGKLLKVVPMLLSASKNTSYTRDEIF